MQDEQSVSVEKVEGALVAPISLAQLLGQPPPALGSVRARGATSLGRVLTVSDVRNDRNVFEENTIGNQLSGNGFSNAKKIVQGDNR